MLNPLKILFLFISLICIVVGGGAWAASSDIVIVVDKSTNIGTSTPVQALTRLVEQLSETAPAGARLSVIGVEAVTTEVEPLAPLRSGRGEALFKQLLKARTPSAAGNIASGFDRALYEIERQGQSDSQAQIIVISSGYIRSGDPASDRDYNDWLESVLKNKAANMGVATYWLYPAKRANQALIHDFVTTTGGQAYGLDSTWHADELLAAMSGTSIVKEVAAAPQERPPEALGIPSESPETAAYAAVDEPLSPQAVPPVPGVTPEEPIAADAEQTDKLSDLKPTAVWHETPGKTKEELQPEQTSSGAIQPKAMAAETRMTLEQMTQRAQEALNRLKQMSGSPYLLGAGISILLLVVGVLLLMFLRAKRVKGQASADADAGELPATQVAAAPETKTQQAVMMIPEAELENRTTLRRDPSTSPELRTESNAEFLQGTTQPTATDPSLGPELTASSSRDAAGEEKSGGDSRLELQDTPEPEILGDSTILRPVSKKDSANP